jgi:hypothetical protein
MFGKLFEKFGLTGILPDHSHSQVKAEWRNSQLRNIKPGLNGKSLKLFSSMESRLDKNGRSVISEQ